MGFCRMAKSKRVGVHFLRRLRRPAKCLLAVSIRNGQCFSGTSLAEMAVISSQLPAVYRWRNGLAAAVTEIG